MAKLEKAPYPGFEKREGETWDEQLKRTEKLLNELFAESAKVDPQRNPIVGAMISFQVADGYAHYRVSKDEPLTLQHVPFLDGYQASAETVRGVTKNTVRTQLARQRAMAAHRDTNQEFYDSLKVGQIVHWHSAFGSYVRCEVVRGESIHSKGVEQNVLKPIALVGDWRPFDLPRRMPDGSVNYGYQAEKIREGKTMTPHESSIWESPRCARRGDEKDPTKMEPVSLEVPAMSESEEQQAALWRKVARLRAIANDQTGNPRAILDGAKVFLEGA